MKSLLVSVTCILTLNFSFSQEQTVMEIDGKPVTKSEFLQIYLKNNPDPKYDKAALDEYMELFKKFKLKVDMRLVEATDFTKESTYEAMQKLMALQVPPQAIISFNDYSSLG